MFNPSKGFTFADSLLDDPARAGNKTVNMDFLKDLWGFMKERKKWWLMPVIFILLLLGVLLVIGGGSAVAPFIYTLF